MAGKLEENTFENLIVEKKDNVMWITLDRPDKLNALNKEMYTELHKVLDIVETDPECRVLVFTGSGKAFCAGGDLSQLYQAATTVESAQERLRMSHSLATRLRSLKQPIIMAVNGAAVGAGLSLALIGDMIICAEDARFGATFLRVGLIPDMGSIYNLVKLLGTSKACELCFQADIIDARKAAEMGLVNRVVAKEELLDTVSKLAEGMSKLPFMQLGLLKKAIYKAQEVDFFTEIEDEINLQSLCMVSKDGREGIKAFLEKRKPIFNK